MRKYRFPLFMLPALVLASCQSTDEEWFLDDFGWSDSEETTEAMETAAPDPTPTAPDLDEVTALTPAQDPINQEGLVNQRAELELHQAKTSLLSEQFVVLADNAFQRGDYKGAAMLYADALDLDPDSRASRDGLRRCEQQLAGNAWDVDSAEDRITQEQMRRANRRIHVSALVRDGDSAMAAGDFDTAVSAYQTAEMALRTSPSLAAGSLDYNLVSSKLTGASQARSDYIAARRTAEKAAADLEAQATRDARNNYLSNRVRSLFHDANRYFTRGKYTDAVRVLDALLELDPVNKEALDLRLVANAAWHAARQRDTDTSFRQQWKATFDELRTMAIPPKNIIEHDIDYWRETVLKRDSLDKMVSAAEVDPGEAAIAELLASTRIEARFENTIEEIADNLAAYTRVNFVVSRAVREDMDEDVKTINLSFSRPMPVAQILSIIEDMTQGQLRFVIRNGVVNVLSAEEAVGGNILNKYEVRDIVRPIQDFVGIDVNLAPSGGIELIEEELPEREAKVLSEDDLLAAIQENIEPDSWDDTATVTIENGTLIVNAPPATQDRIKSLLGDLRLSSNIMVEIKVSFLKVEDSFLQDIGVDFRGLGNDSTSGIAGKGDDFVFDDFGTDPGSPGAPGTLGTGNDSGMYFREASDNVNIIARTENLYDSGLGNEDGLVGSGGLSLQYTFLDDTQLNMVLRAVEKSVRREVLTEATLTVSNTQRATLTVANQVSYVGDFDVEIAQAAAIADPIVRIARDGVYLDVRPVVSADRRFTYIDVRPTVATLVRPIPSFQTSLGTGSPVTMQLPELKLQKIATRVMIPDGGTLLLGGMKIINQQNLESGIPLLNRIPILSFFFSRKGEYESYQKLIILLSARIIVPEEFEPSAEPGSAR